MLNAENELEKRFIDYRQLVNDILVDVAIEYKELSSRVQDEICRLSSSVDGAVLVYDGDGRCFCSECKTDLSEIEESDLSLVYCPNCGVKMSDAIMKGDAVWKSQSTTL